MEIKMKKIIYSIFFTLMCLFISISAYAAEMSYMDGTLTISGLEENAVLIHASYENGIMSDLNVTNATNGTQKVNAENGDKFFVKCIGKHSSLVGQYRSYSKRNKS